MAKLAEKIREQAVVPAWRAPALEQRSIASTSNATSHVITPVVPLPAADSVELIPDSQANPRVELTVADPTLGIGIRWSQRHKPSLRLQESVQQGLLVYSSSILEDHVGDEEYQLQVQMEDPIVFAAKTSDTDTTMRADQALREPDRKEFIVAMENEVMAHHNNGHLRVVPKKEVPLLYY